MKWQPMETAPKDGFERVLLYRIGYKYPKIGWWSRAYDAWTTEDSIPDFWPKADGWMPLPAITMEKPK